MREAEITSVRPPSGGDIAGKRLLTRQMDQFGCLPSLPPILTLQRLDPLELAQAIEQNINEAGVYGHTKITIHLDIPDAAALASMLRRK